MREIKFRAWHKEKMCWLDTVRVYNDGSWAGSIVEERGEVDGYDERECELMQYTGLKDKSGKEIYEGDVTNEGIVEFCDCLNWDGGGSNHPGFYFKNKYEYNYRGDLSYHVGFDENIEVIGNIYENPELLATSTEGEG